MKIVHINYSDSDGGAARAAYRIHRSILASGNNSCLYVSSAKTGDPSVKSNNVGIQKIIPRLRSQIGRFISTTLLSNSFGFRSIGLLRSSWPCRVKDYGAEIVNLHWIGDEMMSIGDVAKISKNNRVVWTLHDMWAFCGVNHYSNEEHWKKHIPRMRILIF